MRERRQELVLRAVRRFGRAARRLGLAIESRALDHRRSVARDDGGDGEVHGTVASGRFGERDGQRAQHTLVRDEGHDHPRRRAELTEQLELVGILRGVAQIGIRGVGHQNRSARANDGGDPPRGRRIDREPGADLGDERLAGGIDVRARDATE